MKDAKPEVLLQALQTYQETQFQNFKFRDNYFKMADIKSIVNKYKNVVHAAGVNEILVT